MRRRRLVLIPTFLGAQTVDPPTPERRAQARRRLGLAQNAMVIGKVGEIHFDKRQSDLVRAVRPLMAERPNVVLALKGAAVDRAEMARVKRAAKGFESRIKLFGRDGSVAEFLDALDLFALSSVAEEAPLVVFEAMSAALPLVSTRVGRTPAVLLEAASGIIVPPRDVAALAKALRKLVDDPQLRARLGAAGRAWAEREADCTQVIDRVEAALERIARLPSTSAQADQRLPELRGQPDLNPLN